MPVENTQLFIKRRNTLSVVGLDEEEQEHNYAAETIEIIEDKESNTQLKSPRESTDLSNNVEFSDNIFYETS